MPIDLDEEFRFGLPLGQWIMAPGYAQKHIRDMSERVDVCHAIIAQQAAELARIRAALEPFARAAEDCGVIDDIKIGIVKPEQAIWESAVATSITFAHVANAANVLENSPAGLPDAPSTNEAPPMSASESTGFAGDERLAKIAALRKRDHIKLKPNEIQSGLDRVRWAELLIQQLPENHDGRNSWLLNYAGDKHVADRVDVSATAELLDKALGVLNRCYHVLNNMAAENKGAIFFRWPINHEPLRHDARNLLPLIAEVLGDD